MNTKELLINHSKEYPKLTPRDLFKFIYHGVYGCEHMLTDLQAVTEFIKKEFSDTSKALLKKSEPLDGEYSRVHLGYLKDGLKAETLGKLFFLSASENNGSIRILEDKLSIALKLSAENAFPFSHNDFLSELEKWKNCGYPAIHHSAEFGKTYRPAYRVISSKYVRLLPLLIATDKLSEKNDNMLIAIEGGSASGKSTLSGILEKIYDCNVFHTDDYFLQPFQRTEKRLSEPGGNLDRERLLEEVILPFSAGKDFRYRRFDCSIQSLLPYEEKQLKKINILEGAYSMHPDLSGYYTLSVFLENGKEEQKKRILRRNTPQLAERFFSEWIPMEEKYFDFFGIRDKCDIIL